MEPDLLTDISDPHSKVYKINSIIIAAFFGGVLAASYMLYKNFKTFGEHSKAKMTIFLTVVLFILLMISAFVPPFDRVPGILYTILITILIAVAANAYQKENLALYIDKGATTYSAGNIVLVCVISILIMVAFVLIPFLLSDMAGIR